MKILIVTPTLYIKNSSFNYLLKDILQGLVSSGNEIVHIVAITDEDDLCNYNVPGVRYVPVVRKRINKANIFQRYVTDVRVARKMMRLIKQEHADLLLENVTYASPTLIKEAKRQGLKVISMFQDVWPDNAVSAGLLSGESLAYKFFEARQRPVYMMSDKMICISEDMKKHLATKVTNPSDIKVIYNWAYGDKPVNIPRNENRFVIKYNLSPDVFYAIYAGNIGRMQNVESVVEVAKLLQDRKDIKFLIVGEGVKKDKIKEESSHLDNVEILPFQDSQMAEDVYSAAGVNIIPLVSGGIKTALPSKLAVCLSCGNPIIMCAESESEIARDIKEYDCGAVVGPNDYKQLAEKIVYYADKYFETHTIEKRYDLFLKSFTKTDNASKYVKEICDACADNPKNKN